MKNYILLLGVAAVSIGSYCAYAGNSATMTVTATIAHDASLSVTQDLDIGTITIDAGACFSCYNQEFYMDSSGSVTSKVDSIISVSGTTLGSFTANIANPSACNTPSSSCGGLGFDGLNNGALFGILSGDDDRRNECDLQIIHSAGNTFKVYPQHCIAMNLTYYKPGKHTKTITISYTAS
ncbi:MAG: hypothetical protein IJ689_03795 [Alphaproteobacteria bacterium]|nr:hypothetical protein [Alphaproteobacteria bacterium]